MYRQPVIEVNNLTRLFGDFVAVDHVSFTVNQGDIIGYLGPNGSGKTTTIRMLLGLLKPDEGNARVLGYDVVSQSEQVRARVGYMSQKFSLYQDLTVGENIRFYAGVYGVSNRSRILDALSIVGLTEYERQLVLTLSVGLRQRLALAISIVHQPKLLFLDEPTSGVDPSARRNFWDLIYELVDGGVTVLVTTHYMDEAEYCGRVGIMRRGKLLAMDTPSNLKTTALDGLAWDIYGQPLLQIINVLSGCSSVIRTGLVSDHVRAITLKDCVPGSIIEELERGGVTDFKLESVEPTLEDVFLSLSVDKPVFIPEK